jgi:SAM-dependent methyltransferase
MERQTHAVLERSRRLPKAAKIAALVGMERSLAGAMVLDVGTGGGYIAEHLAEVVGATGRIVGIDRLNQLPADSAVEFRLLDGDRFPVGDAEFDVVVSNHVIEHVGTRLEQLGHLREVRRVLRPGGVAYLATPNRWAVVEPHFRLPFLSWLPGRARNAYVRVARRGKNYDCVPLSRPELIDLVQEAGFDYRDTTARALKVYGSIEMRGLIGQLISRMSDTTARRIAAIWCIPSLVFILSLPAGSSGPIPSDR